jgi:NTP pyrophosphatase (non-canonical NTP hydrolase)
MLDQKNPTLNEMAKSINDANVAKGFYEEPEAIRSILQEHGVGFVPAIDRLLFAQRIALITSEASEALEANRKTNSVDYFNGHATDIILTKSDSEFKEIFEAHIKDTQQDEIADVFIRLLDLAGYMKIDLDFHVKAKLKYNALRPYKHGKKY